MQLPMKIGIGSGITMVVILLFGWVAFPAFLKHKIKSSLQLKKGSEIREMWTKVPFPVEFKVYIFNITNANDVQKGDIPVVDEIGPYFFDEWKEKENMVDDESDDTVTYNPKTTWVFKPELSGKPGHRLTGREMVTIPHPMLVTMSLAVLRMKPGMLNVLNKALNSIFKNPETAFLTAPVMDILFNGVVINCNVTDFAGKAVCTQLRTEAKDLKHITEDHFAFSFFGHKNGTLDPPFKVKRGIKVSHDIGKVIEFNNKPAMENWPTDECNAYVGTDSTIFAPFLKKEEGLWSYAPDLCRSLGAIFENDEDFRGIPIRRYTANLGDMSKNEAEKCYCPTPDTCLKKGAYDLTKCVGAPIVVTLPHFYETDESYLDTVRGLHPNIEEHGIFLLFEPMTGTPVSARKRLQFNIPLQNVSKMSFMKDLPNSLVPLFWVEEGLELNRTITDQLKKALVRTLKIVKIVKWLIFTISLAGVIAAVFLHMKMKSGFNLPQAMSKKNEVGPPDPQKNAISVISGTTTPIDT